MILNCNSCGKKFVVPDNAITSEGRLVQCGSCGNKWKQFPIVNETVKTADEATKKTKKISKIPKISKIRKKTPRKRREINLYSPEYLAKKHGIKLNDENFSISNLRNKSSSDKKVSFGFYNSLILYIVTLIALSKGLHFCRDFIVQNFPFTEFYIDYFFESMRNIFELWKNLISNY